MHSLITACFWVIYLGSCDLFNLKRIIEQRMWREVLHHEFFDDFNTFVRIIDLNVVFNVILDVIFSLPILLCGLFP